jgi:hypothetical protein
VCRSTQLGVLATPADPNILPEGQVLYGEQSVFAREPQSAAVQRFSTADLQAYHATWERPDNAVLGICGDFQTDQMVRALLPPRPRSYYSGGLAYLQRLTARSPWSSLGRAEAV